MHIYLVGGAVRDQLLGYPIYDRDWVVVGSTPDEMQQQGFKQVGADFPVFLHPETGEEYALARTERKKGKGYKGFQYDAAPSVTLEEDLSRRDLTINAMAKDQNGRIIDPFGGQQDLTHRLLRHVSPAFSEDPLRVLRVARFAARYAHLGFIIAPQTLALMQHISAGDELLYLTKERVWQELERALAERSAMVFFSALNECGAAKKLLAHLQPALTHPAIDTLTDAFSTHSDTPSRFACLAYLAQEQTPNIAIDTLLNHFKMPNRFRDLAQQVSNTYLAVIAWNTLTDEARLSIIQQLDLIRRPARLAPLSDAYHLLATTFDHSTQGITALHATLSAIAQITPQTLMAKGFRGAELGHEIRRLQLACCH